MQLCENLWTKKKSLKVSMAGTFSRWILTIDPPQLTLDARNHLRFISAPSIVRSG